MKCKCGESFLKGQKFCTSCGEPKATHKHLPLATALFLAMFIALAQVTIEEEEPADTGAVAAPIGTQHLSVLDRVSLVDRLIAGNALPGALKQLEGLLAQFPKYQYGRRLKAHLLRDLGRNREAEADYLSYLQHEVDARTQLSLARVQFKQENYDTAAASCSTLLERHPDYAEAHEQLAVIQEAMGHEERAWVHRAAAQQLRAAGLDRKPRFVYLPRYPEGVKPPPRLRAKSHPAY